MTEVERISEIHRGFNPYTDNGGTIISIAGDDFCIAAGDTRQSEGFSINTRNAPKLHQLSDKVVFSASGFCGDMVALRLRIQRGIKDYQYEHGKDMDYNAIAQMLSTCLYTRRFFPYYSWTLLSAINEKGEGLVYSYDPVGSYEALKWSSAGSASGFMQPFLDNQLETYYEKDSNKKLTLEEALHITRDAFNSAAERDIYTGDSVDIFIITKDQIIKQVHQIRKD